MLPKDERIKKISVDITENHSSQSFIVKLNKNGGICEITPRVAEVLTHFQGRCWTQETQARLHHYLSFHLNPSTDEENSFANAWKNGLNDFNPSEYGLQSNEVTE